MCFCSESFFGGNLCLNTAEKLQIQEKRGGSSGTLCHVSSDKEMSALQVQVLTCWGVRGLSQLSLVSKHFPSTSRWVVLSLPAAREAALRGRARQEQPVVDGFITAGRCHEGGQMICQSPGHLTQVFVPKATLMSVLLRLHVKSLDFPVVVLCLEN